MAPPEGARQKHTGAGVDIRLRPKQDKCRIVGDRESIARQGDPDQREGNMAVVVELVGQSEIRGWAVNDYDHSDRLVVKAYYGDLLIGETLADVLRPDLIVGDKRYGFHIPISLDVYLRIAVNPQGLTMKGESGSHGELPAIIVPDAYDRLSWGYAAHGHYDEAPAIFGDSFLLENIRFYNPSLRARTDVLPAYRDGRGYLAMKTYVYGDFMWWSEGPGQGERTAARYFANMESYSKSLIREGKLKILFDMSNEGPPARYYGDWVQLLHDEIRRQGLLPSHCVMITQNREYGADYAAWCEDVGETEPMAILDYDYYISRIAYMLTAAALPPQPTTPQPGEGVRRFVCLNFTPRPERSAFVGWLFGSGLAEQGFVSFGGFKNIKMDGSQFGVPDWFPAQEATHSGLDHLRSVGSLQLDLPADPGGYVPEFDLGPEQCYSNAFFTIVTESDFSGGDVVRITEKVIKPLALGHPIIVVGNPHSLMLLKRLGFRTFEPFIDETYDTIDDRAERMARIQAEVTRLVEMPLEELVKLRRDLTGVIEHNFWHARRGLAQKYREEIEPGVLESLIALSPQPARSKEKKSTKPSRPAK